MMPELTPLQRQPSLPVSPFSSRVQTGASGMELLSSVASKDMLTSHTLSLGRLDGQLHLTGQQTDGGFSQM